MQLSEKLAEVKNDQSVGQNKTFASLEEAEKTAKNLRTKVTELDAATDVLDRDLESLSKKKNGDSEYERIKSVDLDIDTAETQVEQILQAIKKAKPQSDSDLQNISAAIQTLNSLVEQIDTSLKETTRLVEQAKAPQKPAVPEQKREVFQSRSQEQAYGEEVLDSRMYGDQENISLKAQSPPATAELGAYELAEAQAREFKNWEEGRDEKHIIHGQLNSDAALAEKLFEQEQINADGDMAAAVVQEERDAELAKTLEEKIASPPAQAQRPKPVPVSDPVNTAAAKPDQPQASSGPAPTPMMGIIQDAIARLNPQLQQGSQQPQFGLILGRIGNFPLPPQPRPGQDVVPGQNPFAPPISGIPFGKPK